MKEIIYDLDKLRVPAEPVKFKTETGINKEEAEAIIKDLKEVMEADKSIIALAAPQIGINKRVCCIRFNDTVKTFLNPIITKKAQNKISPEIFLSMRGKEILIARPEEITVVYHTDDFKYEDNKLLGPAARIFDQTVQVLDGVLPDELGLVSDIEQDGSIWDASKEELEILVDYYKKFIEAKQKALEAEIETDEHISQVYRKLKFSEGVINGRVQVIEDPEEAPKLNREQRRNIDKAVKRHNRSKGK